MATKQPPLSLPPPLPTLLPPLPPSSSAHLHRALSSLRPGVQLCRPHFKTATLFALHCTIAPPIVLEFVVCILILSPFISIVHASHLTTLVIFLYCFSFAANVCVPVLQNALFLLLLLFILLPPFFVSFFTLPSPCCVLDDFCLFARYFLAEIAFTRLS